MDRKEFLKSACGLGVCGCAVGMLSSAAPALATDPPAEDQRLQFARYQVSKLVGYLAAATTPEVTVGILQNTGRECAKVSQTSAEFKGDPERYFAAAKKAWGTEFAWDKAKGLITVTVAEGPCGCPMVSTKRTPAVWCNCSAGYQKETFETIFGKPVEVRLKESKLSGSTRCVFEVAVS